MMLRLCKDPEPMASDDTNEKFDPTKHYIPMTKEDLFFRYGPLKIEPTHISWPNEGKFMRPLIVPPGITSYLINSHNEQPCEKIRCNIDMHKPLMAVFELLIERGLAHELKTFDGCFNLRFKRGSDSKPSLHCYGLAIDLNASLNPLRGESKWSKEFVQVWHDAGFFWGGDFTRIDAQHFQWSYPNV